MDNIKKIEVDAKLKLADVYRYNMYIAYKSPISKLTFAAGILLVIWLIGSAINRGDMGMDLFISYNIMWIILAFFVLVSRPWKVWAITATQMQQPIFAKGSKYIFYTDKIYIGAGEMQDEVPWETYSNIVETKKDFRFFVDAVQAQIVPKHNMSSEQITALRELIVEANPQERYRLRK